jgi:hemerythrin HHE cation binding domain-containing protein
MPDVFTVLRADHDEVKAMLARLADGPRAADGASAEQLAQRQQLLEEVIIEEARHEAAEQQHFWPAMQALGVDGARIAEQALEQEAAADKVLSQLSELSPGDAEFEPLLARFIRDARSHITFEEAHAWPLLGVEITQARAEELGEAVIRAKKMAPTRPHPSIPPQGLAQKAASPVAAVADKVRDTLSGRGRQQ